MRSPLLEDPSLPENKFISSHSQSFSQFKLQIQIYFYFENLTTLTLPIIIVAMIFAMMKFTVSKAVIFGFRLLLTRKHIVRQNINF